MQYPNFVDDKEFISMDCDVSENEQLRAMLDNLTRVHLLSAKKFNSFDELIREYLHCGIEVFGLETGIVSRIDADQIYHVMDVISPVEALQKGIEFPLADTYCKEVYTTEQVLGFPNVGKLKFMQCHPVYVQLKLEAYLSAPIYVEDKLYGTFNFTSVTPRVHGFSIHEHNLIKLMANSIGNFILLRSKEQNLLELNDQLKRFVGFVSHDLRSPIAGIIGLSRLLEKQIGNEVMLKKMLPKITETAQGALELVGSILETSAISTGKLTLNKQSVSLVEIMDDGLRSIEDVAEHQNVTLKWDLDKTLQLYCDAKMIKQVLINLLVNAVKYSPMGGEVLISATALDQNCCIVVHNKLNTQSSSTSITLPSVYDSVGFGLDIVQTILQAHDSTLDKVLDEADFNAKFSIALNQ